MMKYFTMVGSRSTPEDMLRRLEGLSYALCNKGYIPRSGGADGADTAAENGWWSYVFEGGDNEMEIYVPWNGFNKRFSATRGVVVASNLNEEIWGECYKIAESIHPAWDNCSVGAKSLHARNVLQVLGRDLNSPSKFLVCWAPQKGDGVSGGTNTAWMLAKKHNIPCFNLAESATLDRINKFLDG